MTNTLTDSSGTSDILLPIPTLWDSHCFTLSTCDTQAVFLQLQRCRKAGDGWLDVHAERPSTQGQRQQNSAHPSPGNK